MKNFMPMKLTSQRKLENQYNLTPRVKNKGKPYHFITSEKTFDKIQDPFVIEILSKLQIKENFLNLRRVTGTLKTNSLMVKTEYFSSNAKQGEKVCSHYSYSVLTRAFSQCNKIKTN